MNSFWTKVAKYFGQRRKTIIALCGLALTYASQKYGATNEYVSAAIAVFALVGVHQVPNDVNISQQLQQDLYAWMHPAAPQPPQPAPTPVVTPTANTSGSVVETWGER